MYDMLFQRGTQHAGRRLTAFTLGHTGKPDRPRLPNRFPARSTTINTSHCNSEERSSHPANTITSSGPNRGYATAIDNGKIRVATQYVRGATLSPAVSVCHRLTR